MWEDFQIAVRAGHKLGGRWIGDSSKEKVVLYFHGFPGSRIEAMLGQKAAEERNVTLLTFDRPGLGASDFYAAESFERVADDIVEALDSLSVSRFHIIAVSGGTPYGICVANRLSERIGRCAFVSPFWNPLSPDHLRKMNAANRFLLTLGAKKPKVARAIVSAMAWSWRTSPLFARIWFGAVLPPVDRKILSRRSVWPIMGRNLEASLVQGTPGVVQDYLRLVHPWGWESAKDIGNSSAVWHGASDDYVPLAMAQTLAKQLPRCEFHLVEGGGHFMMVDLLDEVLDWCIQESDSR